MPQKNNPRNKNIIEFGGNEDLKKFYNEYRDLSVKYIFNKNLVSLFLVFFTIKIAKRLSFKAAKMVANIKNDIQNALWAKQDKFYSYS